MEEAGYPLKKLCEEYRNDREVVRVDIGLMREVVRESNK